MERANKKIICALDTPDLDEALRVTKRLSKYVGAFKIGHALTLPDGLSVIERLRDAGAQRVFLDLKFHDIPNSVALAVCEAARRGVWMMTLHLSGGPAMIQAAVEEARNCPLGDQPLLIGVSVLTSLDQNALTNQLGVNRTVQDHMVALTQLAMDCEMDGVVCSPHEIPAIRKAVGHGIVVTPGIRLPNSAQDDQRRVGDAVKALRDGADYLVIGRALIQSSNVEETLSQFGLVHV